MHHPWVREWTPAQGLGVLMLLRRAKDRLVEPGLTYRLGLLERRKNHMAWERYY